MILDVSFNENRHCACRLNAVSPSTDPPARSDKGKDTTRETKHNHPQEVLLIPRADGVPPLIGVLCQDLKAEPFPEAATAPSG